MVNPFTGYRPGVAAIADNKPKGPPPTDPMEPVQPPITGAPTPPAPKQQPWQSRYDQLANWARGNMRRPTTYGRGNQVQQQGNYTVAGHRNPDGSVQYDPSIYGSNYAGPRIGVNNLTSNLIGNPNIWNQDWMRQYNEWLRGQGVHPDGPSHKPAAGGAAPPPPTPIPIAGGG